MLVLHDMREVRPKGFRSIQRSVPPSSATITPAGSPVHSTPIFQYVWHGASSSGLYGLLQSKLNGAFWFFSQVVERVGAISFLHMDDQATP